MVKTTGLVRTALWIVGATALPWVVPAWGTAQEVLGGTIQASGLTSWNRPGCRMDYYWFWSAPSGHRVDGMVEDHELLKSGGRDALSIGRDFSDDSIPGLDKSLFEERLPDALVQSVGKARSLRIPITRLVGGLALVGAGALLATIWSDGGIVVEEVEVSVTPAGGVLASRSFGW